MEFLSLQTILSILFALILLAFWAVSFIILYHLTRFGVGVRPKRWAAIFLFGSLLLFSTSIYLFSNLDLGEISKLL